MAARLFPNSNALLVRWFGIVTLQTIDVLDASNFFGASAEHRHWNLPEHSILHFETHHESSHRASEQQMVG